MSDDEQQLLEGARSGQREALEQLLERYQSRIYRFGMNMCRDAEDAMDVLQGTLLAVARSARDFRGDSSPSTWLFSIARSLCVKKRRKGESVPPAGSPVGLEQAITSLEPMYREVLLLREVEGLTAREVAQVTGASVEAVKNRLHRARLEVRERLSPLLAIRAALPAAPGTCPDILLLYSSHLEGQVSAEVYAEVERHCAACARCQGARDSLQKTLDACRTSAPAAPIPPAAEAFVSVASRAFLAS